MLCIKYIYILCFIHNLAQSYYKVNQLFLVDLFYIGFMLEVAGVGRSGPWGTDPVRNTVHPLLVETCLRLVGTWIPYKKRGYETTSDVGAALNSLTIYRDFTLFISFIRKWSRLLVSPRLSSLNLLDIIMSQYFNFLKISL